MAKKTDGISVILPVYRNDTRAQTSLAIESVLDQTVKAAEIIIVVDGPISSELHSYIRSLEVHNKIKIVTLPKNKGISYAINTGVKTALYPIIARMDADDISLPQRFEIQLKLLEKENLDVVGGQTIEFGQDPSDVKSIRKVPTSHGDIIQFLKLRSPFSHPTVLFKKSLYNRIGGYSENYKIEDYEFFVRCHMHGAKFGNTDEPVLLYRLGQDHDTLRRRTGPTYAKNELKLYLHFKKIGFYSTIDLLTAVLLKLPLRLLPFKIFCRIYFAISR